MALSLEWWGIAALLLAGALFSLLLWAIVDRLRLVEVAEEEHRMRVSLLHAIQWALQAGRFDVLDALVDDYAAMSDRQSVHRNDFWGLSGQMLLAALVVVVVGVLLILDAISSDAAVPILAGVVGVALGKGMQAGAGSRAGARPPLQPPGLDPDERAELKRMLSGRTRVPSQ